MKNKLKKNFLLTGAFFLMFIVFTIIVKKVDVRPIGPEHSIVGLAGINKFVFDFFGVNLLWYDITDWMGLIAILCAAGFAVLGLCQLIKRKSLFKVDYYILLLGVFYIIVILLYILFEFVIINYRPIILHTGLEASYPSSHAMIVVCIMGTAMVLFHHFLYKRKVWLFTVDAASVLLIVMTVIGRLISGVHWFTDIIAGIMLSSALIMLYYSVVTYIRDKRN